MSSSPPDGIAGERAKRDAGRLKFEGDKRFFTAALDRADLIVHGRNSHEHQPNSPKAKADHPDRRRRRDRVRSVQSEGCLVESGRRFLRRGLRAGRRAFRVRSRSSAAPACFGMFMDRYDTFWLSVAPKVRLPGGEPCFPGVPRALAPGHSGRARSQAR